MGAADLLQDLRGAGLVLTLMPTGGPDVQGEAEPLG